MHDRIARIKRRLDAGRIVMDSVANNTMNGHESSRRC
jgi:hypothetical protein